MGRGAGGEVKNGQGLQGQVVRRGLQAAAGKRHVRLVHE